MQKISYPKGIDHNAIDLDFSLKKNLSNLADSKNKKFEVIGESKWYKFKLNY